MSNKQDISVFLDCKVGGVYPVRAEIRLDKFNYISKNIVDRTAELVNDKEDCMYPHIYKETGEVALWFSVKNSLGEEKNIGHKDNWFFVIDEPDILILGTPWLWLFEVSLNLRKEYLTLFDYEDKIRIHDAYS